jgi:hypothetical protein
LSTAASAIAMVSSTEPVRPTHIRLSQWKTGRVAQVFRKISGSICEEQWPVASSQRMR